MSPRSDQENARIRAQQRGRLAAAATRVFARKGFAGTRISDIAAEAGTSHGLVHHYFGSKDALFVELVEGVMNNAMQVPAMAEAIPGTALDRLSWYVRTSLLGMSQTPEVVLLIWHAQRAEVVPDAARTAVATQGGLALQALARLIAAGQAEGSVIAGNPASLAAHLTGFMQGLAGLASLGELLPGFPDADLVVRAFLANP